MNSFSINYRPLKQTKNEIRLWTIHPSHSPSVPSSLDHYSLDYSLDHYSLDNFSYTHPTEFEEQDQVVKRRGAQKKPVSNLDQPRLSPAQVARNYMKSIPSGKLPLRTSGMSYMALSYTWGESSRHRTITVNGAEVKVAENLWLALRALQDDPDVLRGSMMWVDMLCINQNDPKERAQQVERMQQIYTLARRVVVWLGPEAENSDKAINCLCKIYAEGRGKQEALSVKPEKLVLGLDRTDWESIQQFFLRRYFRRLWILQELAAGARNALVRCGKQKVSWPVIEYSAEVLRKSFHRLLVMFPVKKREGRNNSLKTVLERIHQLNSLKSEGSNRIENVYTIFHLGLTSQVTDERDKIYGLMGLMHHSISSGIKPNYEKPILGVYYDFAKAFIKATRCLDIIYLGSLGRTSHPNPTWIPNWMMDREITALKPSYATSFSACGGRPAKVYFPKGWNHLSCTGIFFDFIEKDRCCQPAEKFDSRAMRTMVSPIATETDSLKACLHNTMIMAESPTEAPSTGLSVFSIPWCDNENPKPGTWNQPGWRSCSEKYRLSFHIFQKFCLQHAGFCLNGRNFKDFFPSEVTDCAHPDDIGQSLKRITALLSRRRLVGTQRGFLGLATENVQDGDVIFILLGCRFPLVLRPQGSCYRVVGEIFVYGIMNGEFMEELKQGRCALQKVMLC